MINKVVEEALHSGGEPGEMGVAMDTWRQLTAPRPSLKDYLRAAPLEGLEIERETGDRPDFVFP